MSWLARSIVNSLRLDDEEEDSLEDEEETVEDVHPRAGPNDAVSPEGRPRDRAISAVDRRLSESDEAHSSSSHGGDEDLDYDSNQGRGVREDLSELKDSLTRQFWGVASFLVPPPPPPPPLLSQRSDSLRLESKSNGAGSGDDEEHDEELVEYDERGSGAFRDLANFSTTEDYYTNIIEDAVGITEEVLAFARNIAHHPETWLDFPLSEEEEFDDFDMSDAQYKHTLAVEHLAPRLAALRIELCPVHMSEGYFWMVYFVLLHSRLNKHDAEMLSSLQIVQARGMWMQELQKRTKEESYLLGMNAFHLKESEDSPRENYFMHSYEDGHFGNVSGWASPYESLTHQMTGEHDIVNHPFNEIEFIDKTVIKEEAPPKLEEKEMVVGPSIEIPVQNDKNHDDDDDDWLKEDSDLVGYCSTSIMVNEEDISFSDLEDDLDCTMPLKQKIASAEGNAPTKTS